MNDFNRRGVALCVWSVLGAFLLAFIAMPSPSLAPDADTPLAIDDAGGETISEKSPPVIHAAILAPAPSHRPSLRRRGLALRRVAVSGGLLDVDTNLPTRAPPR